MSWLQVLAERMGLPLSQAAYFFLQAGGHTRPADWLELAAEEAAALVAAAKLLRRNLPDPEEEATARVADFVDRVAGAVSGSGRG